MKVDSSSNVQAAYLVSGSSIESKQTQKTQSVLEEDTVNISASGIETSEPIILGSGGGGGVLPPSIQGSGGGGGMLPPTKAE